MRLLAPSFFLLIILSSLVLPFAYAGDNGGEEHFPALMFLRIEAIGPAVAEVPPLGQHKFEFKYYNGGYFQDNLYALFVEFRVSVEGEGWKAFVYPYDGYFYPNETKIGYVTVSAGPRPSTHAYIHLYGRFRDIYGFWHHANYTFQVKTTQFHSFDVRIEKPYMRGQQEEIYSIPITIRNYGNFEEHFVVIPEYYPPGWKLVLSDSNLIIPPGGKATTYMYFEIPAEGIYVPASNYLIRLRVSVENAAYSSKIATLIVSVEGFHLTLGQAVALLAVLPSTFILIGMAFAISYYNNPCHRIPKPWKEEKDELMKLPPKERRKLLELMKEEWKSAHLYCRSAFEYERKIEKLKKLANEKQRKLEAKLRREWRSGWNEVERAYENANRKLKERYEELRKNVEKKAMIAGIKLEIPPLPEINKPSRIPMPEIPKYSVDERRGILIEPDEMIIKRMELPIRNMKMVMREMKNKIEREYETKMRKMEMEFAAIEKKIDMEIEKKMRMAGREKAIRNIKRK